MRAEAEGKNESFWRNAIKREQPRSVKVENVMGISSNQARFLALTSRQVDLEHRIQQICQRRLRLASSLENTATSYNNKISNRQMYTMENNGGIDKLTVANINALKDESGQNYVIGGITTAGTWTDTVSWNDATKTLQVGFIGGSWYQTAADLGLDPVTATEQQALDVALRAGHLAIFSEVDEFTQSETTVYSSGGVGTDYEMNDWRTIPQLADELYGGDDVDAENKYDQTINEINAQDKKLQLEQTSIEVEYKAITSEKESVKKVLDTNASSSFKYFS